jgi:D123
MDAGPFYGTFLEHWPEAVGRLSMPHLGCVLEPSDARLLASLGADDGPGPARPYSAALTDFLAEALAAFGDGLFLRLGGRSFVTADRGPRRVRSLAAALAILRRPGYRAARMAHRCLLAGRPVWLFGRRWTPMAPAEEFRLFLRDRRLVGASQYHHAQVFPELAGRSAAIGASLAAFAGRLAPRLHLPDVVADVLVPRAADEPPLLIELNPFLDATGRALFPRGGRHVFDGTFRFRAPDASIRRIPDDDGGGAAPQRESLTSLQDASQRIPTVRPPRQ